MSTRTYTDKQIISKYSGKFIDVYRTYDYSNQCNKWEVRGVSSKIRENFNTPEEWVSWSK